MTVETNPKLIKISDEHFIIINGSEKITFKDWFFDIDTKIVGQYFHGLQGSSWMKITHSNKPLESGVSIGFESYKCFDQIKPLSLSEVDELIYGFNIDKMAIGVFGPFGLGLERATIWKAGFKACRELFKDKQFTIDDMDQAYICGLNDSDQPGNGKKMREDYLKSIQPKTEWEVEFDEQGRMLIKC